MQRLACSCQLVVAEHRFRRRQISRPLGDASHALLASVTDADHDHLWQEIVQCLCVNYTGDNHVVRCTVHGPERRIRPVEGHRVGARQPYQHLVVVVVTFCPE